MVSRGLLPSQPTGRFVNLAVILLDFILGK